MLSREDVMAAIVGVVPDAADDALEALIIRWKPAHTAVSFSYL